MSKTQKNSGWKIFLAGFLIMVILMVASALRGKKGQALEVRDNKGMARMQTVEGEIVSVFQDGLVSVWDWSDLAKPPRQFRVPSDRAVFLDGDRLGAIAKTPASTLFAVYDLRTGQKQQEVRVGGAADDVWPAVSPDGQMILIARKIAAAGRLDFEFMTLDLADELLGIPVVVSAAEPAESIVDFAVTDEGLVLAAGIREERGRLLALDLRSGQTRWDRAYDGTREFCSLVVVPGNAAVYAGNRNGQLYKVDAQSGEMQAEIALLQEGETRPITNDVSVLNLSMDDAGQYVAATITPVSYLVDTQTNAVAYRWHTAHRLSSKIAFSPDLRYVATSDLRAGWPVDLWDLEQLKQ